MRALASKWLAPGEACDVQLTCLDRGVDAVVWHARPPSQVDAMGAAAAMRALGAVRLSWAAGATPETMLETDAATVTLGGVPVTLPPGGFLQASRAGEAAIVEAAADHVGAAKRVADLYAGVGTLSLPLAARARVHAVDTAGAAIGALEGAARRHGLPITTEARDLDRRPLTPEELAPFEAVVFDPPRAGAARQAAALAAAKVPRIVAVSCNPATLGRDVATLIAGGYRVEAAIPIDQFLWSAHVEAVVTLSQP